MLPGLYEFIFEIKVNGKAEDKIGHLRLWNPAQKTAPQSVALKPGDTRVVLTLNVYENSMIEPQIYFDGEGQLEFEHVLIRLIQTVPESRKPLFNAAIILPLLLD